MNKKYQQFVPFCLVLAVALVIIILFLFCKPKIEEFIEISDETAKANDKRAKLEEQINKDKANEEKLRIEMQAFKKIYESKVDNTNESLGVFGSMFNDIIKVAQSNGLLIRSIEYNMRPANDPLYVENPNVFNACELKFFFVGTYGQMQAFLNDMDRNFEYLTSISNLSITAFQENPEYLLINETITLYSKKPVKSSANRTRR